jgi:membrane fusion protein, multidrug efflux system
MIQKLKLPLLFILLISILIGVKLFFFSEETQTGSASKGPQGPAQVEGIIVQYQEIPNQVQLTGTLMPNERTDLYAEIQGRVTSILAKEGREVKAGDILVKIHDGELQAQLRKIKAQLELAQIQEARLKKLLAVQGVSKDEYETAFYQLQTLQADLDFTQAQLDKTILRAPYSGVVGLRYISEGASVSPSTRILSMQKTKPLKLDFTVPEKYTHLVQTGNQIHFQVQQDSTIYTARILASEGMIEETTRSLKVRALCEENTGALLPGAFAKIQLKPSKDSKSLVVPAISIIPVLKGQKVLVCRNSQVEEVAVITGLRAEDSIEILGGLNPGDTVLISGIMSLKPGMSVEVTIEGAQAQRP